MRGDATKAGWVTDHGGSLAEARALFPGAPEPRIDLSTGINPHCYPFSPIPATAFTRLPEPADALRLAQVAAAAYGVGSDAEVAAAPGTQALLPLVAGLVAPGRAAVLSPTYAEHARAAQLAGHEVEAAATLADLAGADLAVVVNPNNPTAERHAAGDLLALAGHVSLLVVDEAFMDPEPAESLCRRVNEGPIVVLRSFGKFFGLAGVRLGFAVAAEPTAERLRALLGPWAVSGPALAIGLEALGDAAWQAAMRQRLRGEMARLVSLLAPHGRAVTGPGLFAALWTPEGPWLFSRLGAAGIHVRRFADEPDLLRFGLPGAEDDWQRLEEALR